MIEEVEQILGVESAAFNDSLPLAGQDVREGAIGLAAALALTRVMASLLYGVRWQ